MGCRSCCNKQNHKKGLWSPDEDRKLIAYITKHGRGCWTTLPKLAGLQRCGKSCRLRWINYLRPGLKRGNFSQFEEKLIMEAHSALGNRWSMIARLLPGRTDNEIKNYWHSCIKRKLMNMGFDPSDHIKALNSMSPLDIHQKFTTITKQLNIENDLACVQDGHFVPQAPVMGSERHSFDSEMNGAGLSSIQYPQHIFHVDREATYNPLQMHDSTSPDTNMLEPLVKDFNSPPMIDMSNFQEVPCLAEGHVNDIFFSEELPPMIEEEEFGTDYMETAVNNPIFELWAGFQG